MDKPLGVESLGELIHKEKKQKKTTDKRSTDYSSTDNSSIVQGSTTVKRPTEQIQDRQNRHLLNGQQALAERAKARKREQNIAIDEHLHGWVMEGLVNPDYATWVAKSCHVLGLEVVNRLAINARNGKTPQRLFSSLIKGHMNLKYKQDYFSMDDINPDAANGIRTQVEP
jgi:hypothetical protein